MSSVMENQFHTLLPPSSHLWLSGLGAAGCPPRTESLSCSQAAGSPKDHGQYLLPLSWVQTRLLMLYKVSAWSVSLHWPAEWALPLPGSQSGGHHPDLQVPSHPRESAEVASIPVSSTRGLSSQGLWQSRTLSTGHIAGPLSWPASPAGACPYCRCGSPGPAACPAVVGDGI